jgi:hypothetical protein
VTHRPARNSLRNKGKGLELRPLPPPPGVRQEERMPIDQLHGVVHCAIARIAAAFRDVLGTESTVLGGSR